MQTPQIHIHQGDLPDGLDFGASVAVDSETLGLLPHRDRLCVVQLSAGDGVCHLVQFAKGGYDAPNLKALFADPSVTKIFHYARFDIAVIKKYLGVACAPIYCTKVASRLTRTYTDKHGLKELCRELIGVEISKEQQSSDWASETLSPEQQVYAATDVLYLHRLRDILEYRLAREGRTEFARACFAFLPTRADLDLGGWADCDIFAH
ncbi:ribonuclease D [Varunaivibrio sulfuroxidans]|uniref:Ribonuclease D n=1 Tax=Varunaivibrio sulfuroxidans TaxID=1773489 RepID=A0A4R3JFW9_9PROT|nr:ribonuclease D [Varunaivibrio sulfuroxidans]TCS64747.1 ribonuclease D [Varunaivibrio sulfuroxidans]WES29948.1 ribonuclease D [Varunaivibrio sulfuroxidans]